MTTGLSSLFKRSHRAGGLILAAIVVVMALTPAPLTAQSIFGAAQKSAGQSSEVTPAAPARDVNEAHGNRSAPDEATAPGQSTIDSYSRRSLEVRSALEQVLAAAPHLRADIEETIRSQSSNGQLDWIWGTLLLSAVAIAAGLGGQRLVTLWGRRQFATLYSWDTRQRADKITYLFLRALVMLVGLVVFAAIAGVLLLALNREADIAHKAGILLLGVSTFYLFLRIVFLSLLAPDEPAHRLCSMADHHASGLYRSLMIGTALPLLAFAFIEWLRQLGLPVNALKLMTMSAALLSSLILSAIAIGFREVVGDLIAGRDREAAPVWRRLLARSWHLIAVLYFLVAWAVSSVRTLLDLPDATGLVVAPLQVLLVSVVVYLLLVLLIDRFLLPRLDTQEVQSEIAQDIKRAEDSEGEEPDGEGAAAQARAEAADREAMRSPFRDLLDHGAAILVFFGALGLLARLWGAPLSDDNSVVGSLIQIALVVFLGYMAYRAVELAIARQLAKEGPADKDEEAEIGGTGESRIATLLPIFRNFLLITIVMIAAMVVLSELGVNIGPLFAGAGVVGLAVGFGAQTLIRDIFSGAFYLIDDAFRKGEYIDIGSAKGVVEKISIRSMQLRHHRGALTTVPFGEIQHVENYSRDWAMMKLAFRVTYDTDVEKMRKIIKKFGQELLDDAYYGPMFLQPLKSQGILAMEDSAMIARVKFMTKPGKQFELRKVVYAGLQDLFDKNGIKFAHKQVTVRVAGEGGDGPVDPEMARKAVAGAAASGLIGDDEGDQTG